MRTKCNIDEFLSINSYRNIASDCWSVVLKYLLNCSPHTLFEIPQGVYDNGNTHEIVRIDTNDDIVDHKWYETWNGWNNEIYIRYIGYTVHDDALEPYLA